MKKIIFAILLTLFTGQVMAGAFDNCLTAIANNNQLWSDRLLNSNDAVFKDLANSTDLPNDIIQERKNSIYNIIAQGILNTCLLNIGTIAETADRAIIDFKHNNKQYAFDFDVKTALDYINIPVGILILRDRTKKPGDVVFKKDMPKDYFWPDSCSDHYIFENLSDKAPINIAGQAVFSEYGGNKNEFFIDFPENNHETIRNLTFGLVEIEDCRAFPGLILMDETGDFGSTVEKIVSYQNIKVATERLKAFTEKLNKTECSGQGLSAYLVALKVQRDSSNSEGWRIAASIGAGATVWLATSFVPVAGTILGAAAASSAVPALWPISIGLAVVGGAVMLMPTQIEDIQQLMILSNPYPL